MRLQCVLAAVLVAPATAALTFEDDANVSPIQRVTKLLQEMKAQLASDAKKDEEMASKLQCWCKTNKAEKEQAIKDGDAKTDELVSVINENSAKKGKLGAEIKQMKKELTTLRSSLESATALREKERQAMRDEEVELVKTVTNLKNALAVLQRKSMMQLSPELVQSISTIVHSASAMHEAMFGSKPKVSGSFLQAQSGASAVFLQAIEGSFQPVISEHSAGRFLESFAQGPAHLQAYSSQAGGIIGILKSMLDNFEANMSENAKNEADAQQAFVELKASSNAQIKATSEALDNAKLQLADAAKTLADAKDELEKTREVRAADVEFLRNLKVQCMDIDKQWADRQKERASETAAVSEALAVLSDDDTRELLLKSTSFVQLQTTQQERKSRAAAFLRSQSRKAPSWEDLNFSWTGSQQHKVMPKQQLATLAVQAQLDSFTKVKAAMDKMVAEIKSQMATDVKHKAFCTEEFNANAKETKAAGYKQKDEEAKIEDLAAQIAALQEDVAKAGEQIKETQVEMKKAGEDREAENKIFQDTIQEQRATQAVLKKVVERLNQYYASKEGQSFLQAHHKQSPPGRFETYNKSSGASPVLALIGKIVDDSKKLETESVSEEKTSQKNYETFIADSNNTIKQLQDEIVSNTETKAAKAAEKVQTEESLSGTMATLENLANYKADLHGQCDFVMKNFEMRQEAMQSEIEAIGEAKAILSGAK
jgi:hypothetical protein